VTAQRVEHRVPAGALAGPDAAQVPLQLARRDQLREHELRQRGVAEVGHPLAPRELRLQRAGCDQPAQPEPGGKGLGHAAGMDDPVRGEALERGNGCTVVAVLGVVVVLHDEPAPCRPLEQRTPPVRREHDPGREVVRGRHEHDGHPAARERLHVQAVRVHRDGHRFHPPVRQLLPGPPRARVLDPDPRAGEQLRQQPEPLGDPRHDDQVLGASPDPAHSPQPARELVPQHRTAPRVAVAEVGRCGTGQHRALGTQPRGTRERGQVRHPGRQVDPGPGVGATGRKHLRPRWRGGHSRATRAIGSDQPIVEQHLVGRDNHAARDGEVGREHPGRR
jgi:hypothetical protein